MQRIKEINEGVFMSKYSTKDCERLLHWINREIKHCSALVYYRKAEVKKSRYDLLIGWKEKKEGQNHRYLGHDLTAKETFLILSGIEFGLTCGKPMSNSQKSKVREIRNLLGAILN